MWRTRQRLSPPDGRQPTWRTLGLAALVFVLAVAAVSGLLWLAEPGGLDRAATASAPFAGHPRFAASLPAVLAASGSILGALLMLRLLRLSPPRWTVFGAVGLFALAALGGVFSIARDRPAATAAVAPSARAEGCLSCHADVTGLDPAHRPEAIGCAACHGGDRRSLDAKTAHAGMVLIPGNLADAPRTCGTNGCHDSIVPRLERSIMTTFSGVIAADRRVFGVTAAASALPPNVRELGHDAADSHLRQLCASCHLGQPKTEWGPIGQQSRGGGCNACHLVYTEAGARELAQYTSTPPEARRAVPRRHPALTIAVGNDHCFGCHSRSGRISTNYEGWHELREPPPAATRAREPSQFRQLDDGRTFVRVTPDIHQQRGLECIDCHNTAEVMGAGATVAHKTEQLRVRCEDCHAAPLASRRITPVLSGRPPSVARPQDPGLDAEVARIAGLRHWPLPADQRFGTTRAGDVMTNVLVDDQGRGQLRRKRSGELAPLLPPGPACAQAGGHARLSCGSCHSAWAPRCATCHTSFDPAAAGFDLLTRTDTKGAWTESSGPFEAIAPTLGIRLNPSDPRRPDGVVDTFVPGMILNLDRRRDASAPADPVFRRLYAPIAPHTIRREARSCQSCHSDPVALGYGRGVLRYEIDGARGRWRFTPTLPLSAADGLPEDAWIGFLQTRTDMVSSRDGVRPFAIEEQRRILRVGACLTCHAGDSPVMQASVVDFEAVLSRLRPSCALPLWP